MKMKGTVQTDMVKTLFLAVSKIDLFCRGLALSAGRLVGGSVGRSVGRWVGRSVGWSVGPQRSSS